MSRSAIGNVQTEEGSKGYVERSISESNNVLTSFPQRQATVDTILKKEREGKRGREREGWDGMKGWGKESKVEVRRLSRCYF